MFRVLFVANVQFVHIKKSLIIDLQTIILPCVNFSKQIVADKFLFCLVSDYFKSSDFFDKIFAQAVQAGQSQYFAPLAFNSFACARNPFAFSSPKIRTASGDDANAIKSSMPSISSSSSLRYLSVSAASSGVPTALSHFSAASFAYLQQGPALISAFVSLIT